MFSQRLLAPLKILFPAALVSPIQVEPFLALFPNLTRCSLSFGNNVFNADEIACCVGANFLHLAELRLTQVLSWDRLSSIDMTSFENDFGGRVGELPERLGTLWEVVRCTKDLDESDTCSARLVAKGLQASDLTLDDFEDEFFLESYCSGFVL
jgi:hypothetical protein